MKFISKVEKINIVNFNLALQTQIESEVEQDNATFALQNKSKLLRRFILYRMSSFLLHYVNIACKDKAKFVLYLDSSMQLDFLASYELYIKNTTRMLSRLLGISIYKSNISLDDFVKKINAKTGESIELKNKLCAAMYKNKKLPNLQEFYNLLSKNNIHKVQDSLRGELHLKLGLFVT